MSHDIPPIGQILPPDSNLRDCSHFAYIAVTLSTDLKPGDCAYYDRVRNLAGPVALPTRSKMDNPGHGIIDPFLAAKGINRVKAGQRCLLFLYPGSIKGLKHVFEHPDFPEGVEPTTPPTLKGESEVWMREWAMTHMGKDHYNDYGKALSEQVAYERAIEAGKTNCIGCYEDARDHIDDTWWTHWERITGLKGNRDSYFSCAC